jgi:hypothetical protein
MLRLGLVDPAKLDMVINAIVLAPGSRCIFHLCCFELEPSGRQGNMEQVVPNGGFQWLLKKPCMFSIRGCALYCTHACAWPFKWATKELHLFVTAASFCPKLIASKDYLN